MYNNKVCIKLWYPETNSWIWLLYYFMTIIILGWDLGVKVSLGLLVKLYHQLYIMQLVRDAVVNNLSNRIRLVRLF